VARPVVNERFPAGPFRGAFPDPPRPLLDYFARGLDPRPRSVTAKVLVPIAFSERNLALAVLHNAPDHRLAYHRWTPWRWVPKYGKDWVSGCPDLESLDTYFGPYMEDFGSRFGYSVYAYEVPADDFLCYSGLVECHARLDNARLLWREDCDEYAWRRELSSALSAQT
jgi:hypothetical protein